MYIDIKTMAEYIRLRRECAEYEKRIKEQYDNDYPLFLKSFGDPSLADYRGKIAANKMVLETIEVFKIKLKQSYRDYDSETLVLEYVNPRTMEDVVEREPITKSQYILASGEIMPEERGYKEEFTLDITSYLDYENFAESFSTITTRIEDYIIELAKQSRIFISFKDLKKQIIGVFKIEQANKRMREKDEKDFNA